MLADELDFVIGVDTHRDRHALAVVACPSGARVFEASVEGCERGYAEALALAPPAQHHGGRGGCRRVGGAAERAESQWERSG